MLAIRLCIFSGRPFEDHLKTHSGEKLNKCDQCEYASYHAHGLKVHMVTHSREKPHKCSQCEYTTSLLTSLRRHMKIHMGGVKIHKCNQCEYASYQTGNLRLHSRNQSGEKPIKWIHCDCMVIRYGIISRGITEVVAMSEPVLQNTQNIQKLQRKLKSKVIFFRWEAFEFNLYFTSFLTFYYISFWYWCWRRKRRLHYIKPWLYYFCYYNKLARYWFIILFDAWTLFKFSLELKSILG